MVKEGVSEKQHNDLVVEVERRKCHFPDAKHPNWKSYTNHPRKQVGIVSHPEPLFPDIVVLDKRGTKVAATGNLVPGKAVRGIVQVERSVGRKQANQWKKYGEVTEHFHVFVPGVSCQDAQAYADEVGARIFSFWRWRAKDGYIKFDECP